MKMGIKIGQYTAEGPFTNKADLKDESGVYIILGRNNGDKDWKKVIDVGESSEVKKRIEDHDRESCWTSQGYDVIGYAVIYESQLTRTNVERNLREQYNPPCGER